jgi:hypothetical protein
MEKLPLQSIRQVVVETLARLGADDPDSGSLLEKPLRYDPEHLGCRFQYRGIRAVWFADTAAVDFFADDGQLLATVAVPAHSADRRAA